MIQKLTKATTRLLAILLAMFATTSAWANFDMKNPVTGETETYTNKFTGTNGSWNEAGNWDTGSIPYVSGGVYTSALVDGGGTETVVTGTSIDVIYFPSRTNFIHFP